MYKILYPTKDATLYQRHPDRNTGVDQILELTKLASGSSIETIPGDYDYWGETLNTRILMDFDISEISSSIAANQIKNPRMYLKLYSTDAYALPIKYTIWAYPVSSSWMNGTGYYNNNPEVTNGVSWNSRNGKSTNVNWSNAGGDYISSISCSKTIDYEVGDLRMDVTKIVTSWISGSIPNYGIMLKRSSADEESTDVLGSIKYFSKDTHTIYVPRLEVVYSNAESTSQVVPIIDSDTYIVWVKNMKEYYKVGEKALIRVGIRPKYVSSTYSLTSDYLKPYRLPVTSYFSVVDVVTNITMIEYDDIGTQLSYDDNGSYFIIDFSSFMPVRFYKFVFKIVDETTGTVEFIDDDFEFKVIR